MESCNQHSNQKIEFVCLDKLCKAQTCFACFSCVRTTHQKCSDETLLEMDEFLQFEICYTNRQPLSNEIMNRTNIDLRRALGIIRQAFLKKKDFLLDFMSLTKKDFIDHLPRIHSLYEDLLLFDNLQTNARRGNKNQVTISSKFRFKSPEELTRELEDGIIGDFKQFMAQVMDLKDCHLEPVIPDQAKDFQFKMDHVEVMLVEGKSDVLEFYSKAETGSSETTFAPGEGFMDESTDKSGSNEQSDASKEVEIRSKKELQQDQTWK